MLQLVKVGLARASLSRRRTIVSNEEPNGPGLRKEHGDKAEWTWRELERDVYAERVNGRGWKRNDCIQAECSQSRALRADLAAAFIDIRTSIFQRAGRSPSIQDRDRDNSKGLYLRSLPVL